MPANSRVFLKPFIGGLNTEASDTDDMVLNTSDELNCTILPEQMRGRRYGFNIEKDGKWINAGETITAHSLYHWNNVDGDRSFIVVQINSRLVIYEDTTPCSLQDPVYSIDLSQQFATLGIEDLEPLSMTSVNESLFIVSRWIYPLVLKYNKDSMTFEISINNLKFRDFNGVNDGFAVDYMPLTGELNQEHMYNLYNQGWDKSVYDPNTHNETHLIPLANPDSGLFYTAVQKYPSNNLQWFIGKQNSGKYNTYDLLNTYFGNTPAPKGHYILDYINRNRSYTSGIYLSGGSAVTPAGEGSYMKETPLLMHFGDPVDMWFFYGGSSGHGFSSGYVPANRWRFDLPAEVTGVCKSFLVSIKDIMKQDGLELSGGGRVNFPVQSYSSLANYIFKDDIQLQVIGINGNGVETVIHTQTLQRYPMVQSSDIWTQYSVRFDNNTSYSRYSVKVAFPNATWPSFIPFDWAIAVSVASSTGDDPEPVTADGLPSLDILSGAVTDVESFGGRIFYLCNNTVLFSQTLSTGNLNYDKCYQDADPTSEEVSDVVATDGGMIHLLSLGRGKALKSFYRGVLVFGDKEVTGIMSNYINLFSANDYDVVKITNAGISSKYSVVETDNNVFYWSNHGIYMVGIDENNNISASCISLNTVQNWYLSLSQFARDNCVGYYDYANNRIYWFYPTTNNADKLDGCLVYDLTYNSFMPQYIDSGKVVRDLNGNFAGLLNDSSNEIVYGNYKTPCTVNNNIVYDTNGDIIGYTQNKFLTDCQESSTVNTIKPTVYLRAGGNRVVAGDYKVLASADAETVYDRKSAGIFLVSDGTNYSFGDFNDREFRDWDVSPYESYLVSRPITLGDTYFNKQTPVMQTLFKRTETYKLIDAPTASVDLYNITYPLIPIINTNNADHGPDHWVGNVYKTVSKILNKGVFQKTVVNFDLTNYSNNTSIMVIVKGYTHGSDRVVAKTTEYAVAGNQIKTIELDTDDVILYPDYEYDSFEVVTYITATYGNPISVYGTFDLHRNDLSEEIFDGYDERVYTGAVTLTKLDHIPEYAIGADNFWEAPISTEQGYIKNGTLTTNVALSPKPSFSSSDYFVPGEAIEGTAQSQSSSGPQWSATAVGIILNANEQVYTGVEGIPDYENRTVSGSAYRVVDSSSWKIALEDLVYNTVYWRLPQVSVNYTFTIMVPKFRKLSTALPSGYTTPSGAYIRMRWGWSLNPLSNRWDMVQNGYRPQKDFLHDDYVESRLHIRGRGKAFQVEIRNEDNKDFRLTGLNIITRSPQ